MVTTTFLTNFALGFILAMEVGQVSIEVFRRGTKYGFRHGILTALGGTFADLVYLNIAVTGIILVLNRPEILQLLWVIGGGVVLYLGINGIYNSPHEERLDAKTKSTNSFIVGFLLNFIHPLNLIWWVTILSSIIIQDIQHTSKLTAYLNGSGILFGVFAWWLILCILLALARQWFTFRTMRIVSISSSYLLIGFSVWFFYNAFTL